MLLQAAGLAVISISALAGVLLLVIYDIRRRSLQTNDKPDQDTENADATLRQASRYDPASTFHPGYHLSNSDFFWRGAAERLRSLNVVRRQAPRATILALGFIAVAVSALLLWKQFAPGMRSGKYERVCTSPPSADQRLTIMPDLHGFHQPIFTTSQKAQTLFDQGMLFAWDFNQPEALKCFQLAAEIDQEAPMLAWGIQYAIGPGANRAAVSKPKEYPAFTPEQFDLVQSSSRLALTLAEKWGGQLGLHTRELAFASAAVLRWPFGSQSGPARDQAERHYSAALQKYGESEHDSAALAMAAEALMNLNPWEYYLANGSMKASAQKAELLINAALALDPQNPLANHLLIHISEASSTLRTAELSAARAESSANRMHSQRGPWKAYQGHLQHMPSHTFIRIGRYHDAAVSNVNAFNADLKLAQHCMVPYEPEHNTDMLIFAASMAGQVKTSLEFAQRIKDFGRLMFYGSQAEQTSNWAKYPLVLVHFGRWGDIFKLQAPSHNDRANCPSGGAAFAQTVWRFARLMAIAARTEAFQSADDSANSEQLDAYLDTYLAQLHEASSHVKPEEQTQPPAVYLCEHRGLADIYELIAYARVSYLRGNTKEAIAKLQNAARIEDSFLYMEPPRVYQPVRQCLGFMLLQSDHLQEAELIYREDLVQYPDNGWSLHGLSAALHAQSKFSEVDAIRNKLKGAWANAEDNIDSSCLSFSRKWEGLR